MVAEAITHRTVRDQYIRVAGAACCVFAALDAVSTWIFLHNQTGVEGNPFIASIMAVVGVIPVLLVGTVVRFGMIWGFTRIYAYWPKFVTILITLTLAFWAWVVFHNVFDGSIW